MDWSTMIQGTDYLWSKPNLGKTFRARIIFREDNLIICNLGNVFSWFGQWEQLTLILKYSLKVWLNLKNETILLKPVSIDTTLVHYYSLVLFPFLDIFILPMSSISIISRILIESRYSERHKILVYFFSFN